ncbi:MAG: carboxylesterase [Gammaproteobacteria bacterium]|nr:carboxylesterase [Gammaproteobacteria bacterium]
MLLETIEVETAAAPDAAVIWLHGLGADGNDFVPVVPELVRRGERAWRFVFPHATARPVTINGGMRMRAWYDILSLDRKSEEDESGFRETAAAVRELISREVERGVPANRIVLAGFSQGGAVSLYTAPRYPERLAGVMVLSAYLPLASRLAAERAPANQATPIFMAHGLDDATLPVSMGLESRDYLKALGFTVEWHQYPMAHAVCAAEIADIRDYLLRVLPDTNVS